jgi:hypothetical protein
MSIFKKRKPENADYLRINEDNNIDYDKLISQLNGISINNNNFLLELNESNNSNNKILLLEMFKKIDLLEKKVDELNKINFKIDTLQKNIDKILIEKDYTIENLNNEIQDLKADIMEKKYSDEYKYGNSNNKTINDYFY